MKSNFSNINLKVLTTRVLAYLIDLLIVMVISTLVSSIPLFSKNLDKYQVLYDKYEETLSEYTDTTKLFKEYYKDNEISKKEYEEIIKDNSYADIIIKEYDDEKITKSEYKTILSKIDDKYKKVSNEYNYKLQKTGILNSILTLTITLLYFGVFQWLLKGQTIGKKILKIKIISSNKKPLNILIYCLRSLVLNNIFLNAVGLIFLSYTSKQVYTTADQVIGFAVSFVEAIIIFMVMTRNDNRGLHDLLCHTQVISTKEEKKDSSIIEAKIEEKQT